MYCNWFFKDIITREYFVIDDFIKWSFYLEKGEREIDERETIEKHPESSRELLRGITNKNTKSTKETKKAKEKGTFY